MKFESYAEALSYLKKYEKENYKIHPAFFVNKRFIVYQNDWSDLIGGGHLEMVDIS